MSHVAFIAPIRVCLTMISTIIILRWIGCKTVAGDGIDGRHGDDGRCADWVIMTVAGGAMVVGGGVMGIARGTMSIADVIRVFVLRGGRQLRALSLRQHTTRTSLVVVV